MDFVMKVTMDGIQDLIFFIILFMFQEQILNMVFIYIHMIKIINIRLKTIMYM
ncbi:MAG: hypothetical protein BWY27_00833 [Bacteroidetes bacterium ADurb.Bin234]|nr:MAG: hypothetical protein BWY27_00833 [Bacteroidetes bacterium ADurb.Bin234]